MRSKLASQLSELPVGHRAAAKAAIKQVLITTVLNNLVAADVTFMRDRAHCYLQSSTELPSYMVKADSERVFNSFVIPFLKDVEHLADDLSQNGIDYTIDVSYSKQTPWGDTHWHERPLGDYSPDDEYVESYSEPGVCDYFEEDFETHNTRIHLSYTELGSLAVNMMGPKTRPATIQWLRVFAHTSDTWFERQGVDTRYRYACRSLLRAIGSSTGCWGYTENIDRAAAILNT